MDTLFDPQRHEALTATSWSSELARRALERICRIAEDEFDERSGSWQPHPDDEPNPPGVRSLNLYWGATGVVWALQYLAHAGAVRLARDYGPWIERYPDGVRQEAAHEQHGTHSYLFGESSALLLAWLQTRREDFANRLYEVVQANLHNPANEPLWGNAGTALAAIRMAEAGESARWTPLVLQALQALLQDMVVDPDMGTWTWEQDLYGDRSRYLGAGHGLAGNAFAVFRGAHLVNEGLVQSMEQRVLATLSATALHATQDAADGPVALTNWHIISDQQRLAAWLAKGGRPFVQDCHGAPGIVCRLAGVPHTPPWDSMLRGAGEVTWHAGPLRKGASLCHGTAGSAMACLKLWRRFAQPLWLDRARLLAMHAIEQVEAARERHGQGRNSLWTGDLGVACVLWSCIEGNDRFPTLDVF